jgi:hypothetical protein
MLEVFFVSSCFRRTCLTPLSLKSLCSQDLFDIPVSQVPTLAGLVWHPYLEHVGRTRTLASFAARCLFAVCCPLSDVCSATSPPAICCLLRVCGVSAECLLSAVFCLLSTVFMSCWLAILMSPIYSLAVLLSCYLVILLSCFLSVLLSCYLGVLLSAVCCPLLGVRYLLSAL